MNTLLKDWIESGAAKQMPSGCIEWQRYRTPKGYGTVKIGKKKMRAHRAVMGDPAEVCVLHSCDNPSCVNPEHLRLGTVHENALDMKHKKRGHRVGKNSRCLCGRAISNGSRDCHECRSVRLLKPKCDQCEDRSIHAGLCSRHYNQRGS